MINSTFGIWRLNSHIVLPLVFDDALSYLEQVGMLIDRVNALQKDIVSLQEYIKQVEQGDRIQKILVWLAQISQTQQNIINDVELINERLQELEGIESAVSKNTIDIMSLKKEISGIWLEVSSYITYVTAQNAEIIANLIEDVKNMVSEQICTRNGDLMIVRNPVTGNISSLNQCLEDLYDSLSAIGGVTIEQYRNYKFTMLEYQSLHLNMFQYAYAIRWIILDKQIIIIEKRYNNILDRLAELKDYIQENINGLNPLTNETSNVLLMAQQALTQSYWGSTINQYYSYGLTTEEYVAMNLRMGDYNEYMLIIMLLKKLAETPIEWRNINKGYNTTILFGIYRGDSDTITFPDNTDYPYYVEAKTDYTYDMETKTLNILNYRGGDVSIMLYYMRGLIERSILP